jgi:hypothetical protein
MSIQAVAWVLEESESTNADRLVLIAIANHIGATGWAWPCIPTIAHEAGVGRATVYRSIDALEELGELAVRRRPGKTSLYGLAAMPKGSQFETGQPEVEGSQSETGGVSSARREGSQSGTRTIKNHQEPKPARARGPAREPTDTSPITIQDWVPTGELHGPTKAQREVGLKAVRQLLQKDEPGGNE